MTLLTAQDLGVTLAGRTVLTDVSLSLSSGHLVALVGPNGAGKTTLLRALAGLVPSTGAVDIRGEALSALPLRERAKRFAYLPQGHVFHWPMAVAAIKAIVATIGRMNAIADKISDAINEQNSATQEIARNVQEAANGTREVTNNIVGVSEAAEETGTEAQAVLTSANQLSQHAAALRTAVEHYLQGIRAA